MTRLERICLEIVPFYGLLLFLVVAGPVFMLRAPIVVVTDDVFSAVYGPRREHLKRIEMSVRLFRRVKLARIAEEAETEVVVFAVQDAARRPLAAVFPYRYYDAALRYAQANTASTTAVISGTNDVSASGAPALFVKQDEAADFYRAGLCAALFSARLAEMFKLTKIGDGNKKTLVINGRNSSVLGRESFERGLRDGGSNAACDFRTATTGYSTDNLSCAAFWGPANDFLYGHPENTIPTIIFSWIDPAFSSPNVKVIIDDSPLQLLPAIVRSLSGGAGKSLKARLATGASAEILVPSAFMLMSLRTGSLPLSALLTIRANLPIASFAPQI
ncbi:MAG: hypothetical protein LBJ86_02145 [Spirochaetaceae bacterium]|jgi:hypothetical protein|nr:hypothetical protein [Spirochaetaceae bacterium]